MILVPNERPVVPFVKELNVIAKQNTGSDNRQARTFSTTLSAQTTVNLPFTPVCEAWIQLYLDGHPIYNTEWQRIFTQVGSQLRFNSPITGALEVICDTQPDPLRAATVIPVKNIQGAKTTELASDYYAATMCEPIIITQPVNGHVRLTGDRLNLAYVPNAGYKGPDSFAYSLITQRGQIGDPICVIINVV